MKFGPDVVEIQWQIRGESLGPASCQFGRTSLLSSFQRALQPWLNEASVGKLLSLGAILRCPFGTSGKPSEVWAKTPGRSRVDGNSSDSAARQLCLLAKGATNGQKEDRNEKGIHEKSTCEESRQEENSGEEACPEKGGKNGSQETYQKGTEEGHNHENQQASREKSSDAGADVIDAAPDAKRSCR